MKKISIFPIISLIISIIAFVLYIMVLEGATLSLLIFWSLLSIISVFMPTVSKFFRKRKGKLGKTVEIISLIIGCFSFYFLFFALTKISIYIVYIMIFGICFLYAKAFKNVEIK